MPSYGFLVSLGVIAGLLVVFKVARQQGLNPDQMWNLGALVILAGLLGAKIMLVINDWSYYSSHPREIFSLSVLQSGGVFSGGLMAAIVVAFWYVRKIAFPSCAPATPLLPAWPSRHAFGRVGCFAAGCCYGKPTNEPWGVTFTNPLAQQMGGHAAGCKPAPDRALRDARRGHQFLVLYWLVRRKKFDGQVIGLYLILYGVARYFLEFFRGDPGRGRSSAAP